MAFSGTGHRLGSEWGSDFVGDDGRPVDIDLVGHHPADTRSTVPSLREICISTLDRYVDLLEDLGATPYYLIESVLKKCSVKQLTRIEEHTEGLDEMTDELWYHHALNKYKDFREENSTYDQSGEWRAKYLAKEQEELERYERERAKLRQSYSRHDKIRQDRSVIVDPTLRLPKKTIRPASGSSGWGSVAPKKKTLFEKAREEARKITQMYKSNPYPPPKSRTYSTNTPTNTRRPIPSTTVSRIQLPTSSSSRHVIAPNSVFAGHQDQIIPLGTSGPGARTTKARYNYKVRPVVYTTVVKPPGHGSAPSSTTPQHSPTRPSIPASGSSLLTASAPGAIADFFKQINPIHTRRSTTSHQDTVSRSPTSPVEPPSKTMQQLRETPASVPTASSHTPPNVDPPARGQKHARSNNDRKAPQFVKNDGDFRWLEESDDDEYEGGHGDAYMKSAPPQPQSSSRRPSNFQGPAKKPMTEEEAGKLFFNNLMGK